MQAGKSRTLRAYDIAALDGATHTGPMDEVIFSGDETYYPHARLTPIGGLWEGAVEIVSPNGRLTLVCAGVHDDSESAFSEAVADAMALIRKRN